METFPIGVSSLLMGLLMYVSLRLTSVLVLRLLLGIVVGTLSYSFFCYIFKLREFGFIKRIIRRV